MLIMESSSDTPHIQNRTSSPQTSHSLHCFLFNCAWQFLCNCFTISEYTGLFFCPSEETSLGSSWSTVKVSSTVFQGLHSPEVRWLGPFVVSGTLCLNSMARLLHVCGWLKVGSAVECIFSMYRKVRRMIELYVAVLILAHLNIL